MGMPIIGHLHRAGFKVLVNERDAARRIDVEARGGIWCADLVALAAEAQAILICVGYDSEVRELLNAAGGLLDEAPRGTIIAILSTIHPKTMKELAGKPARAVSMWSIRPFAAADELRMTALCCRSLAVKNRLWSA